MNWINIKKHKPLDEQIIIAYTPDYDTEIMLLHWNQEADYAENDEGWEIEFTYYLPCPILPKE